MIAAGCRMADLGNRRVEGVCVPRARALLLVSLAAPLWGRLLFPHHLAAAEIPPPPTEKHYALGMQRLRKEDWAGAAAEFKEVVKLDNRRVDAYDKLGVALAKKGETDGAKVAFEKALQLNPRDAVAHENLATASQRKMGRPKSDESR